jgi:hypothetical protein
MEVLGHLVVVSVPRTEGSQTAFFLEASLVCTDCKEEVFADFVFDARKQNAFDNTFDACLAFVSGQSSVLKHYHATDGKR